MTTITQLYNNIKTFVLQVFESKSEEDVSLPDKVENMIQYVDGKMTLTGFIELEVTGSSFSTTSSTPFTYTGKVFIDWGDDTELTEYTGGQLLHDYSTDDNHTIRIYGRITSIESRFNQYQGSLVSIKIPDSVISLGPSCFSYCFGLSSITIPNSVISLGRNCFEYCQRLDSINIPNSVTTIGSSCFYLTKLTSITIPKSVTTMGGGCFNECNSLRKVQFEWDTESEIITYDSSWIMTANPNIMFYVPAGTRQLYIDKGYPSAKLVSY